MIVSEDYLVPRQPSVVFAVDFFLYAFVHKGEEEFIRFTCRGKKRKKKIRLFIGHCLFSVIVVCTRMSSDD